MVTSAIRVTADRPFNHTTDPRESLRRDGYAYLPGLLDADELAAVRSALLRHPAQAGWLAPGTDPDAAVPGPRVYNEQDLDTFMPVYGKVQATEEFHALGQSPRLLELAESVLGEPSFCLPFKIARFSFPGADPTAPHQDYYYIRGSADTLTVWLPLSDCPAGQGRLIMLAGSHRLGAQRPIPLDVGGFRVETDHLDLEWHGSDYKAGDVVIFHALTIHAAEANEGSALRVSVDVRFQPVADRIEPESLEPHMQPASWDELYQGWSRRELQYYWRDLPLNVVASRSHAPSLAARARSKLFEVVGEAWA